MFFVGIDKLILTFIWEAKGPGITQSWKKNKFRGLTLSEYKIFHNLQRRRVLVFSL